MTVTRIWIFFFCFSSRRRHTRSLRDWSSDVCSSDLRSWQACALPGRLNSTPWCVAVHPADPRLVFACTNLGQLFRSEDGGETWRRLEHEFGEVRALHWRALPAELPRGEFTLTKRTV